MARTINLNPRDVHHRASREDGDPTPAQWAAHHVAPDVYEIAHDEQLAGAQGKDYRIWLIDYELEKLWHDAQAQLLAQQRSRPGLRGWIARKLDL